MRWHKNRNQLLIIFLAVGFLIGIFYGNIMSKKYGYRLEVFQTFYLQQLANVNVIDEEFLWYIVKNRMLLLIVVLFLTRLRWKRTIVLGSLLWTGYILGMFTAFSVIQLGVLGMAVCVAGTFPHIMCYAMACGMILIYMYFSPNIRWTHVKTMAVIILFFIGIMSEVYLSPCFLKIVIRFV